MNYDIITTRRFDKSLKQCIKRGLDITKLKHAVELLSNSGTLPSKYRPHKLSGNYEGVWECHIESDWLLLWEQNDDQLILLLIDTVSHSDLF